MSNRTNIVREDDPRELAGWFSKDAAERFEMEPDPDQTRGETLYRTRGGRWVLSYWSKWEGESTRYYYTTRGEALAWLRRENRDEDAARFSGPTPHPRDLETIEHLLRLLEGNPWREATNTTEGEES